VHIFTIILKNVLHNTTELITSDINNFCTTDRQIKNRKIHILSALYVEWA